MAASTTLTNCTVSGNSATVSGGGLFNGNVASYYGAHGDADQLHRQRQLRLRRRRHFQSEAR